MGWFGSDREVARDYKAAIKQFVHSCADRNHEPHEAEIADEFGIEQEDAKRFLDQLQREGFVASVPRAGKRYWVARGRA